MTAAAPVLQMQRLRLREVRAPKITDSECGALTSCVPFSCNWPHTSATFSMHSAFWEASRSFLQPLCPRVSFPIFFVSYSEKILSAPFRRADKQKSRVPSFPHSSASHTSPPQPDLCRPGPRAHWPFVLSPRPLPERSVPSCAPVLVPGACCIFRSEPARALSLPRKPRSSLLTSLLPSWSGCAHTPLRLVI